jgi:hypothetical protein
MSDPRERKQINVSPLVKEHWATYKLALKAREGRAATDDELIGAFLDGVPLWQANLMVGAYLRSGQNADDE